MVLENRKDQYQTPHSGSTCIQQLNNKMDLFKWKDKYGKEIKIPAYLE